MKIKTIFLFVCVSVTCLAVQFGIYKGIVRGAVDPCPQTTTKSSIPCPYTGPIIASCSEATTCIGDVVFYSAEVKNTAFKDNKPAETYTTVVEYIDPNKYQCATVKRCYKEEYSPYNCKQFNYSVVTTGKLYTEKSCLD